MMAKKTTKSERERILEHVGAAIDDYRSESISEWVALAEILSFLFPIRADRSDMRWAEEVLAQIEKEEMSGCCTTADFRSALEDQGITLVVDGK